MEQEKKFSEIVGDESSPRVSLIDENVTMLVNQFSFKPVGNEIFAPKTEKDVYDHFQPSVEVTFHDEKNQPVMEELKFDEMLDFEVNDGNGKMVKKSTFLSGIQSRIEGTKKVMMQLENNPRLRIMLKDESGREAFKAMLQSMLDELNQVNK